MTSEPWLPVPYDPAPYESALDSPDLIPGARAWSDPAGTDGGSGESSAPANPAATADAAPPAGALTFHCAACLLEWDEPFCDICGANLTPTIDRAARPSSEERPRGPEGDPC